MRAIFARAWPPCRHNRHALSKHDDRHRRHDRAHAWQLSADATIMEVSHFHAATTPAPASRSMPILEAIQVFKDYGSAESVKVPALRGVDVRVEPGEFLAIMGPSGCGKSTLLHVLGGIDTPTSGRVLLDGADFGSLSDAERSLVRRRRLGFVFQKMNLLPTLSAVENVALPLRIDGASRKQAQEQAAAVLERVQLAHRESHFPHELSGGEQQRVAVARALVIRPAVLLADEPTGALDTANGQAILALLRSCADVGQTVVMVTHDAHMARTADRLLLMRDGLIVDGDVEGTSGAPADVSNHASERR
jgi:putative ABC transport system ATP-binding protein